MAENSIVIDGREIGPNNRPYIIAELSGNHNGKIDRAIRLIDEAKAAGADAVKLQTYTADTITIDHDGPGFIIEGGLWNGRKLHDLYAEASTPWDWHKELFDHAKKIGITAFSSPFDYTAIDLLEDLDVPAYKIASFELTDLPLVRRAAATGKPLIMSTGMATHDEIQEAIDAARSAGAGGIAILHCISGYPTPIGEASLTRIPLLREKFGTVVGLSDHTMGVTASTVSIALGAAVIEKHFTLRRSDGGPDGSFSLEPEELAELCTSCADAFSALKLAPSDKKPSEEGNRAFRRSLYVVEDVAAGEPLNEHNVRSIRPGYGMPPKHYPDVLGRRAARDLKRGEPLSWDQLTPA